MKQLSKMSKAMIRQLFVAFWVLCCVSWNFAYGSLWYPPAMLQALNWLSIVALVLIPFGFIVAYTENRTSKHRSTKLEREKLVATVGNEINF